MTNAASSIKTTTRAWDLKPGDVPYPIGLTIRTVNVDGAGAPSRTVHISHDLGTLDLPINQTVHLQNTRDTELWD